MSADELAKLDGFDLQWIEGYLGDLYLTANDAPIALGWFPYNRCEVWHCARCERHLLRYTEFGGYNVDPRVRELAAGK